MKYLNLIIAIVLLNSSIYAEDVNLKDTLKVYQTPSITVSTSRAEKKDATIPYAEINKSDIDKRHTTFDLPTLLNELPSILTYSENGNNIGYTNLSLRGFDQRRIAVMINGIPHNDMEDHNFYWINLSDFASTIDNIQVQRGAGLSTYGPAAIGGSILISTNNYLNFRGINISAGIGLQEFGGKNDIKANTSRYAFEYSSGLVDNYAFYAKYANINSDGYRDQSWANLNSYFFSAIRIDDNFTTQLNFYGGWQEDGLAYNGLPISYIKDLEKRTSNYNYFSYERDNGSVIDYTSKRRPQEVENFSQPIIELLNDWQIASNISLKNAIFYKIGEGYFDYDGTGWTDKYSFRLTPENGFPDADDPKNPIIRAFVKNKTGGWLPRLLINNSLGDLIIGAEFRLHSSEHWGKINFAENLPKDYDPDYKFYSYNGARQTFSIFAGQNFKLTEKLLLNADAQLVYHNYNVNNEKAGKVYTSYKTIDGKIITNGEDIFNVKYLFFNPKVGASYQIDQSNRAYLSLAYTSREPRRNNLYRASDSWMGDKPLFNTTIATNGDTLYDFSSPLVKPEKMFNIELGWNYDSDLFSSNLNFYYMDYKDELVKSGQLDIFGAPIDGNAPKTRHYGIEFLAKINLLQSSKYGNLNISTNFTYSQNKIVEYDYYTRKGEKISLADNNIAGFPDLIANLRLTYNYENFILSTYFRHNGKFYTDNFGDLLTTDPRIKANLRSEYYTINTVDAYNVINLDAIYNIENFLSLRNIKLHLQINNLTNEMYSSAGFGKEFFPAAERNYFFGITIGI